MKTKTKLDLAKWVLGVSRALTRATIYAMVAPSDHYLLDEMTDADLVQWHQQHPKQRRYALQRRQWAHAIGREIKMYPRSSGRAR